MPQKSNTTISSAPSTDDLIRLLDRWQKRKMIVVGDFMVDRYTYGDASRLSPDAPVPVLATKEEQFKAGGASNVCLDLIALQCDVTCLGVIGNDDTGKKLIEELKVQGCKTAGLVKTSTRPTTVKHNFVGLAQHRHPQKMFRVDYEDKSPIDDATANKLFEKAKKALPGAAALCIEDYDKGVLTPKLCQKLIKLAKSLKVPVLVDPAAIADYSKYQGATCITPNRNEASLATGIDAVSKDDRATLDKLGKALMTTCKLEAVALTLDKQGALLIEKGKRSTLVPTEARSVYDVTGAGDMVLAMLAAALANNATWQQAVALANTAAGLEVERFGIVPITLDEVLLALLHKQHEELGKHREIEPLLKELAAHRSDGKRIAFTNGCFDILHAGHVSYLRQARKRGDLLVVALNSDKSIKRIKGEGRPVNHETDRVLVLSELQSVDYVILFSEDTPTKLIKAIKPDVLVKGGDYKKSEVVGGDFVESYGGKVELVPVVKGRSTTNIIRKMQGEK
jgi:D-beta-D-heptose 7-phosphate kinase / D-beta-D-heptose 1-phosphate adenosyltransferase